MQTLSQSIAEALARPRERAFAQRLGERDWTYTSSGRMLERASAIAAALHAAGLAAGDRVALVSNNSVEWIAADFGILLANCVTVPVFATLALDQLEYIFADSGAKLCFVETQAEARRVGEMCPSAPRCIFLEGAGAGSLDEFERSAAREEASASGFEQHAHEDDLAVLIYTSGTTGTPKGVMLSHRNILSNARAAATLLPADLSRGDRPVLSVLPFAHIYEHTIALIFILSHSSLHVTRPDHLFDDLRSVRPCVMALVPRVFERMLAGIYAKASAEGPIRSRLIPWALRTGRAFAGTPRPGVALRVRRALAWRLVLSKIRPAMGLDRLQFFMSGSAPLHRDLALTFAGMGIPIAEGYGLTETSPVVTGNPPHAIRYGSVGRPIPGVEIRLAADGEILVRGPNVMCGYYRLPEERPFTEDGWFRTGDVGEIDADGYLFITDRKKELLKTSAGKYVAPGRVEAALKRSTYIGQCFVVGDGRAFPVALICPNWALVRAAFRIAEDVATETIARRGDVLALIEREATEKTADLGTFEQIRRVALLSRDLTVEAGELSPTMKIRRRVVEREYAQSIETAYR